MRSPSWRTDDPSACSSGRHRSPDSAADCGQSIFDYQLKTLREERNFSRFPPSRAAKRLAGPRQLWSGSGEVEVRRYASRFLHGKAYILGSTESQEAALVTSANLTGAGLYSNLELGLVHYQPSVTSAAIAWFDELWADAASFRKRPRRPALSDADLAPPTSSATCAPSWNKLHEPLKEDPDRPLSLGLRSPTSSAQPRSTRRGDREPPRRRHLRRRRRHRQDRKWGSGFVEERTKESGHDALIVTPAQLEQRRQDRLDEGGSRRRSFPSVSSPATNSSWGRRSPTVAAISQSTRTPIAWSSSTRHTRCATRTRAGTEQWKRSVGGSEKVVLRLRRRSTTRSRTSTTS